MSEQTVRPIDAEALKDAIGYDFEDVYCNTRDLFRCIDRQPTLDYAPVVRCKDCVFYDSMTYANPHCASTAGLPRVIDPDNFCSRGIRRSEVE